MSQTAGPPVTGQERKSIQRVAQVMREEAAVLDSSSRIGFLLCEEADRVAEALRSAPSASERLRDPGPPSGA